MNGHSTAETLAFCMTDIARRWPSIGDMDDGPIFVFAGGWGSAEREFARRLTRPMADESALDPALVGALASQLARTAHVLTANRGPGALPLSSHDEKRLTALARAQAMFLRNVGRSQMSDGRSVAWGMRSTGLTGDYALYFKVLFPRAKFLFLHRNPLDAFAAALEGLEASAAAARDQSWVESFADAWCRLIASFKLWQPEVDGILIDYDAATAPKPAKLEAYLGERLSPPAPDDRPKNSSIELRADEIQLLADRTGDIAASLGYSLAAKRPATAASCGGPTPAVAAPKVHTGATRISCAVLVPAIRYIEPECDEALWELERRGYCVQRVRGCSPIDHARSRLATAALDQGFAETIWIDADTQFDPESVDRLRSHGLPIVAGVYPRRHPGGGLAVSPMPGTRDLVMGDGGSLIEVLYAGTGFLYVRSDVYVGIQQRFDLPLCDEDKPARAVPFFMPMLEHWGSKMSYLAEDYAFSRRARLCGFKIMADTSIRLWHLGMYRYGYEDAGNELPRLATYRHLFDSEASESTSREKKR
jgi:hypothetical protein